MEAVYKNLSDLISKNFVSSRPDLANVFLRQCVTKVNRDVKLLDLRIDQDSGKYTIDWNPDAFSKGNEKTLEFQLGVLLEGISRNHLCRCRDKIPKFEILQEITSRVIDSTRLCKDLNIPLELNPYTRNPDGTVFDLPDTDRFFENLLKKLPENAYREAPKDNKPKISKEGKDEEEETQDSRPNPSKAENDTELTKLDRSRKSPNVLVEEDEEERITGTKASLDGYGQESLKASSSSVDRSKGIDSNTIVNFFKYIDEEIENNKSLYRKQRNEKIRNLLDCFRGILKSDDRRVSVTHLNKRHPWLPGIVRSHRRPKLLAAIDVSASMPASSCFSAVGTLNMFLKRAEIDVVFWNLFCSKPVKYNKKLKIPKPRSGTAIEALLGNRWIRNYQGILLFTDGEFMDPGDAYWNKAPKTVAVLTNSLKEDYFYRSAKDNRQRQEWIDMLKSRVVSSIDLLDLI